MRPGVGALWRSGWLQVQWGSLSIASSAKEFFPIVVAAAIWGAEWCGSTVCFYCDNLAVVEVLNRQAAKRSLFYISARFDFDEVSRHTLGVANVAADAISRNNLSLFRSQVPGASLLPTPVSPELASGISSPSDRKIGRHGSLLFWPRISILHAADVPLRPKTLY